MQLAGRYKQMLNNPSQAALASGAAGAGLVTLGNITSGEASQEGPGRLLLESLQGGVTAASAGLAIPSMRRLLSKRTIAENLKNTDLGKRATGSGPEIGNKYAADAKAGFPERKGANRLMSAVPYVQGLAGAGIVAGAGGVGGLYGGGYSNLAEAIGVPGFQSAIDPELPGSSNTINSRLNMQGYV
tara:strand:- start:9 stop:566 length:558 start_codon:yes stop_codon:yes gene_type:complete